MKIDGASSFFEIPYYHDYISPRLARKLLKDSRPVKGVAGLVEVGQGGGLEDEESLKFLTALYSEIKSDLKKVLNQRIVDRKFIDERVKACCDFNIQKGREITDVDYKTIIGLEDANGRIVLGPKRPDYCGRGGKPIAPIPEFLKGPHVTLFGPPDSAKMAINAMNAYHRRLKNEPPIVAELLGRQNSVPKWGADDEDSKTPLRADLVDAGVNLTACFEGDIRIEGDAKYVLAKDHLSIPIKRFPGLALPSTFLFLNENPIPLHLYDFALHLFKNWHNPQALVFYVPKLENEEEAAYIHKMISVAERMVKAKNPSYVLGSVRLMIVLENPRAILRAHEIMDALHPYFVGASLGWHDYLASTARVFKEDSHYRIPVKADPDIVIKYIKASHLLLAEAVGSRGGIKVGGMYGILPQDTALDSPSFQMTLLGFIKDVVTQMKRDLTGYWVAHPDFVRLGLALVEAWLLHAAGDSKSLETLVKGLLQPEYHKEILGFIHGDDIKGLDSSDPNYVRSLLVADIKESDFIANNHPDEIRYNVFQSLQYLTDWLSGNGCVALPASVRGVPVRVMDDLATAERSRWEVWHELYHGRFDVKDFIRIVHEEMHFIRKDLSDGKKIVQVKWDEKSARWYPVAMQIMLKLMTDHSPAEFATELLMPFTADSIRGAADPFAAIAAIDPEKYRLRPEIDRLNYYFSACGSDRFAASSEGQAFLDFTAAENLVRSFSKDEVIEAAYFHGDIGEAKMGLDAQAASEQKGVSDADTKLREELLALGQQYRQKFGFKFLISAKGKSGSEMLTALKERMQRSPTQELDAAREALWEITRKRLLEKPLDSVTEEIGKCLKRHNVTGASVAINLPGFTKNIETQKLCFGDRERGRAPVDEKTQFQIASLSKVLASAFAIEYFASEGISLDTSVDDLLAKTKSAFRVGSKAVQIQHLLNHTALNLHYVNGLPANSKMPSVAEILQRPKDFGYEPIAVCDKPGEEFHYSGGGFMVLEHLLEQLGALKIFKSSLHAPSDSDARGYFDSGEMVPGGYLQFPLMAAGAWATPAYVAEFLAILTEAYKSLEGKGGISHDTSVQMLHGRDLGSREFMGADMGLGVFIIEAGENKFAVHQGANEGFRALFMQCFAGPDYGKGFVICANGDNRAVGFIAEVAQTILRNLKIQGIDFSKFQSQFDYSKISQEQIVNLGYKKLIFSAFAPQLPPPTERPPVEHPLAKYNLAVGGKIISVTNQKFALAENLLSPHEPVFDPELFCPQGKVMDSWETVRHNQRGHDTLEFVLKEPSPIQYISVSTRFHDGNHFEYVEISARESSNGEWTKILDRTHLEGHSEIKIKLKADKKKYSQIRVDAFPDGGLTRLGLYGDLPANEVTAFAELGKAKCVRFKDSIPKAHKPLSIPYDPSDVKMKVVSCSNEHYGPVSQVVSPFPPIHMFDGFESARSRKPNHNEEIVLQLKEATRLQSVVFDFTYFVNNNPMFISVDGKSGNEWIELAPKTAVKAYAGNQKSISILSKDIFNEIRVKVYPDGGIHRIRVD